MQNLFAALPPADQQKIMQAIETLLHNNNKFPDQLHKLAALKKDKPFIWNMALQKLTAQS
jgi:hypothetical protein